MKKKAVLICILIVMSFIAAACSSAEEEEDYAETTITVSRKGKVSETIVEDFSKDYYDVNELRNEFADEIGRYNESIGAEEIRLGKVEVKDSRIFVNLDFTGPSDYESFIGQKLFVGSISEAYDNGYSMDVMLKGVESGDKISKIQIMGMPEKNIVILSEHARIRTFKDIAYVSANVDMIDDREARVLSESDGLAYLVLK